MLRKEEPVRLSKTETVNIPTKVILAGSFISGIIFAAIGIVTYHYGVFL